MYSGVQPLAFAPPSIIEREYVRRCSLRGSFVLNWDRWCAVQASRGRNSADVNKDAFVISLLEKIRRWSVSGGKLILLWKVAKLALLIPCCVFFLALQVK